MADKYFVDDCCLFIGLVTEPVTEKEFFVSEFKEGLFNNYLKKLKLIKPHDEEYKMYSPFAYRIFGEYDLAIFSLVDDLEFGLQIFKPLQDSYNTDEEEEAKDEEEEDDGFIYNTQVINGLSTYTLEEEKLTQLAKNTFLRVTDKFPYIGITKLKVNNGILIGNGVVLLEEIKAKLKERSKLFNENTPVKIEQLIIDTFCNNELTIISFSNSYAAISEYILNIKNIQINAINNSDDFLENSLLKKIEKNTNIKSAHLFAETNTIYGYDYEYEKKPNDFLNCIYDAGKINFSCSWRIKPGHISQFLNAITKYYAISEKGSTFFKNTNTIHSQHTFSEILELPKIKKDKELAKHIKQFKTTIHFPLINNEISDTQVLGDHPALTDYLRNFVFKRTELATIRKKLNDSNTAKSSVERVLSMYNNFNNCIVDPFFFISFLELRGYLDHIKESIIEKCIQLHSEPPTLKLIEFNVWLNECIRKFELAYSNRFHQSNRTNVLPNNSLEFNGGIQQFVSIFDTLYKSALNPLGSNWSYTDFIYVSGFERVQSEKNVLRINISHILHPELFATIIYKEGINFTLNKLQVPDGTNHEYIQQNEIFKSLETFTESNKNIYKRIILELEKSDTEKKYSGFIKLIDKDLVFNFFADIAVYRIGFDCYDEAFFFWYWKYFRQINDCYNADTSYDEKLYRRYLTRFFVLKYFLEEHYSSENEERFNTIQGRDNKELESFCKLLYNVLKNCDIINGDNFFTVSQAVVKKILRTEILADFEISEEKKSRKNRNRRKRSKSVEDYDFLTFRREWIEERSNSFQEKISNGEIITDFKKLPFTDSSYVQCFLNAYLTFLYEFNLEINASKNFVQPSIGQILDNDKIIPNPKGGIKIIDPEARIKYNKYRAVFYKTLWDFSMKIKYNYLDILSNKTESLKN
jgi:hypothetical protein